MATDTQPANDSPDPIDEAFAAFRADMRRAFRQQSYFTIWIFTCTVISVCSITGAFG